MTNVKSFKAGRKDVITSEEFNFMLKKIDTLYSNKFLRMRNKAFLSILYLTGKRISEVMTMKREDIEYNDQYLKLIFYVGKKRVKEALKTRRVKKVSIENPYAKIILEYLDILGDCQYLFPSGRSVFGNYIVDCSRHLTRQMAWKIIVDLDSNAWAHLFRETKAARIVRRYGNDIKALYMVKQALDLKSEQSAWAYIDRYGEQLIEEEELIE